MFECTWEGKHQCGYGMVFHEFLFCLNLFYNCLGTNMMSLTGNDIYTLMRFPRAASCKFISVKHGIELDMRPA